MRKEMSEEKVWELRAGRDEWNVLSRLCPQLTQEGSSVIFLCHRRSLGKDPEGQRWSKGGPRRIMRGGLWG